MTDDRHQRITRHANAIWQEEGQADRSHQQLWDQATAEMKLEDELAAGIIDTAATVIVESGAPLWTKRPQPEPFARRGTDAPRQAGTMPRPTDNPISGANLSR